MKLVNFQCDESAESGEHNLIETGDSRILLHQRTSKKDHTEASSAAHRIQAFPFR